MPRLEYCDFVIVVQNFSQIQLNTLIPRVVNDIVIRIAIGRLGAARGGVLAMVVIVFITHVIIIFFIIVAVILPSCDAAQASRISIFAKLIFQYLEAFLGYSDIAQLNVGTQRNNIDNLQRQFARF